MGFAVLEFRYRGNSLSGTFILDGPQELKKRVGEAMRFTYNVEDPWEGGYDEARATYGKCEIHKVMNWIESSGWAFKSSSTAFNSFSGSKTTTVVFANGR